MIQSYNVAYVTKAEKHHEAFKKKEKHHEYWIQTNKTIKIGTFSCPLRQYYYLNNNLLGKKYKPIKGSQKINQTHLFNKHTAYFIKNIFKKHKFMIYANEMLG